MDSALKTWILTSGYAFISLILVFGLVAILVSASVGDLVFNKLPTGFHGSFKLLDYKSLEPVALSMNKSIIYGFKAYYPLEPGRTVLKIRVEGIECNVSVKACIYEHGYLEAVNSLETVYFRRYPYILVNLEIVVPPKCNITSASPLVKIDAVVR